MSVKIPQAFAGLFQPKRYKVFYGGRGSSKSHSVARALLIRGMERPTRILCLREIQNSIEDSVHKLLSDIISTHKLEYFYDITKTSIRGKNGTEFIFKGVKHNLQSIKSTEGVDIAWVEEAQTVSNASWEIIIPTVRDEGSEIWVTFNPKNPTDPTYTRMVKRADADYLVKKVSWRDNPFWTDVLEKERIKLQAEDDKAYLHVYEGEFDERNSGCIYANILAKSTVDGRICPVPYKPGVPVITAWDLGKRHATSIWFAQVVGLEPRIFDYHEAYGDETDLDVLAGVIRDKGYEYKMHWLPHDARHDRMGMKSSISKQLEGMGIKNKIVPSVSVEAGIGKAKALLKEAWIDEKRCADGLHALMNYHYEYDDNRERFKDNPHDDWSADASDALRYLAIAMDDIQPRVAPIHEPGYYARNQGTY